LKLEVGFRYLNDALVLPLVYAEKYLFYGRENRPFNRRAYQPLGSLGSERENTDILKEQTKRENKVIYSLQPEPD